MQEKFCRTAVPSGTFSAFGDEVETGTEIALIALALIIARAPERGDRGMPLASAAPETVRLPPSGRVMCFRRLPNCPMRRFWARETS